MLLLSAIVTLFGLLLELLIDRFIFSNFKGLREEWCFLLELFVMKPFRCDIRILYSNQPEIPSFLRVYQ